MKIILPLVVSLLWPLSAFAGMRVDTGTPQGFEQLDAAKATVISIYYGGNFLGNFPAKMTPSTIQFDNAHAVIASIPEIRDKEKVTEILQQPLPVNANKLCTEKRNTDCNNLTPDIAGIIFNAGNLNGELFINKNFLSISNSDKSRYLPLPEKKFSSVYMFNGAANGVDGDNNYTVSGDGILSFGETKLSTSSSVSDNGLRFDRAELIRDRNGWQAGGGLFRSRPMQLINDVDMAGVTVATSDRTILDKNRTQGNDILVYLPRRSFVSIYREGRLYSSRAYEAGNQLIDTHELPEGAYTITLRIQESDGTTREEQRFFAKNQEIPPADRPVYYAQAGVVRTIAFNDKTIPQLTSKPIVKVGTVRRLSDTIGLGVGMTGINDRAATETGIYWIKDTTQLRVTGLASTSGDFGINTNFLYNKERLTAAIDARQLISSNAPDEDYQNLFSDVKQVSGTIAFAMQPNVTFGARANYSAQKRAPTAFTVGPYAQWRIWQRGESTLELNADVARSNNQNQGDILLRFTHRFGPSYGMTGSAGSGFGATNGALGNIRGWYERNEPDDYLQIGARVSRDGNNNIVSTDADWRNNVGQLRGSIQDSFGGSNGGLGYGGNFAIGAAQVANHLHVGGNQNDQSAVVVSTSGDAKTKLNIFVNGMPRGTVQVGKEQVIYVSPYHTYNIRVAPEKTGLYDYNTNDRKVTLYPGNVANEKWVINNFYVVVATIIKPDGQSVQNALLQESRQQVTTNDQGILQAELPMLDNLHLIDDQNNTCQVTLPQNVTAINGVLLYREPLVCQPISQSSSLQSPGHPISNN